MQLCYFLYFQIQLCNEIIKYIELRLEFLSIVLSVHYSKVIHFGGPKLTISLTDEACEAQEPRERKTETCVIEVVIHRMFVSISEMVLVNGPPNTNKLDYNNWASDWYAWCRLWLKFYQNLTTEVPKHWPFSNVITTEVARWKLITNTLKNFFTYSYRFTCHSISFCIHMKMR